ncbi:MAG: exo-alpha-sialidase, partial [Desulfobacteraceae bacterium]|nr:exo-alpha-sialidase [Desulfobacteraceae bacterium]
GWGILVRILPSRLGHAHENWWGMLVGNDIMTRLFEDSSGDIYWAFTSWDNKAYLYRSTDGGSTFSEHSNSPITTKGVVEPTYLFEDSSGNIYWTFGNDTDEDKAYLYLSTEGGDNFSSIAEVPTGDDVYAVHLLEDSSGDIYWAFASFDGKAYLYHSLRQKRAGTP